MSDKVQYKRSDKFTMFVPGFIDDYGFTPPEFRIFSRIMRRCLGEHSKGFFESITHISQRLKISESIVRRTLKILEDCNAITRTTRPGQTDLIDFQTCDKWKPAEDLPKIRAKYTPVKSDTPSKSDRGSGVKSDRGVVTDMTGKGRTFEVSPYEGKETHTNAPAQDFDFPLKEYFEAFPETFEKITPSQIAILQSAITNPKALKSTIEIYQGNLDRSLNRYLPEKVGNFISTYKSEVIKLEKQSNGTSKSNYRQDRKKSDAEIFDDAREFYENYPA